MKVLLTLGLLGLSFIGKGQEQVFPVIKGFGGVYPISADTAQMPDTARIYYLLADVTMGSNDPAKAAPGLVRVAKILNLMAVGGVPMRNVRMVVVVHGSATTAVMGANSYRNLFGYSNPNLRLLEQLHHHKVQVMVCGQAWLDRGYAWHQLVTNVDVALSALTALATYQQKGYTLFTF